MFGPQPPLPFEAQLTPTMASVNPVNGLLSYPAVGSSAASAENLADRLVISRPDEVENVSALP